jgi:predicted regulator of Ras-like GTPase activity (Roadblock/LC7/MglB family)
MKTPANEEWMPEVTARIEHYATESGARRVILLDASGHVITATGAAWHDDVALGALLAGLFGSARALGTLLGEPECHALFQQGGEVSIYTVRIGDDWLLLTAFDHQTQVGLIRLMASEAAVALASLLSRVAEMDLATARATIHSQDFRASFDDTLDRFFQDAEGGV